jgi:hypothetical protein
MAHYVEKIKGKAVLWLEVAQKKSPYTNVMFEDGSMIMTSYCISDTIKKLDIKNCVLVNRSQAVDLSKSEIKGNVLTINDKIMKISRRKLGGFLVLFCVISQVCFGQVAVNDTLYSCFDIPAKINVFPNDTPTDGIRLSTFTQPTTGELVSQSNTGLFRYYWDVGINAEMFQYKVKLINSSAESSYATVFLNRMAQSQVILSGNYPNTTLTTIVGCQITTAEATTFISGSKYTLEHYKYTELLPGTTIDATGGGSVLIQAH